MTGLKKVNEHIDNVITEYAQGLELKKNPNLSRKTIRNLSLSEETQSIILGTILGDGSLKIYGNYVNARLVFKHSDKQKEYFYTKVSYLKHIATENCVTIQKPDKQRKSQKESFCYQSRALPDLTAIWKIIGQNSKKVTRSWLNLLTPLSIAIWWCDDGSIVRNGKYGHLSTNSFSKEEVYLIIQWFEKNWNLKMRIVKQKKKPEDIEKGVANGERNDYYFVVQFSTQELVKFLWLILPYCPCEEMLYKYIIRYRDTTYQQRWISLMKERLPVNLQSKVENIANKIYFL